MVGDLKNLLGCPASFTGFLPPVAEREVGVVEQKVKLEEVLPKTYGQNVPKPDVKQNEEVTRKN